jgi:UDP-N-acetylglucosamine/UDP-N-acetylgalactosamine diphosphorylase
VPLRVRKQEEAVIRSVRERGQGHVLRWLDELEADSRRRLLSQLAEVDFDELDEFRGLIETPPTDISFGDVAPPPVARVPLTDAQHRNERRVIRQGWQALEADRVAALTAAGGQGTRMGYDHPKGTYPITPVRKKSLFQHFAEQILAARRRYRCRLPWLIMNGPSNDAETRRFFADNGYFGLGGDTVHFFTQQALPVLDTEGKLLLAEKDQLLTGPDGHGGIFEALANAGLLDMLRAGGWDLISYWQVDNPLATIADPRFLGHHLRKGADFSCKVVPKRSPAEGLGLAVRKSGVSTIVEYIDVPDQVAAARVPSGKLRFTYGSVAMHIMSVPFVERVAERHALPWHIARKQYPIVDQEGPKVLSAPQGCCKFERYVFDALPLADECAFVEVRRDAEFAPVKSGEGEDSPATARRLMQRLWLQWLRTAGVAVQMPTDLSQPHIEISPLFALDEEELKERIEPGWQPEFPLVLEPSGTGSSGTG